MNFKKVIAIMLCMVMLITQFSTVMAVTVEELAANSNEVNKEILSQLTEFAGEDAEEAYSLLDELGLLDENGDLITDENVIFNGQELTVDEIYETVSNAETDLTQIAYIGETPVALGDLKTILEIEKELERIKETYFSGREFTTEQTASLNELIYQIQTGGIEINSTPMLLGAPAKSAALDYWKVDVSAAPKELPGDSSLLYFPAAEIEAGKTVTVSYTTAVPYGSWDSPCVYIYKYDAKNPVMVAEGKDGILTYTAEEDGQYCLVVNPGVKKNSTFNHNRFYGNISTCINFNNAVGMAFILANGKTETNYAYLHTKIYENAPSTQLTYKDTNPFNYTVNKSSYGSVTARFYFMRGSDNNGSEDWNKMMNLWFALSRAAEYDKWIKYANSDNFAKIEVTLKVKQTNNAGNAIDNVYAYDAYGEKYTTSFPKKMENGKEYTVKYYMHKLAGDELCPYAWIGYDNYPDNTMKATTVSSEVTFIDPGTATTLDIKIPAGTYQSGNLIPIYLKFNEFMVVDSNATIKINNVSYKLLDLGSGTAGGELMVWYPVKDIDSTNIVISAITGVHDVFGNKFTLSGNKTFNDVKMESCLLRRSATVVSTSAEEKPSTDNVGEYTVNIAASLNTNNSYVQKYSADLKAFSANVISNKTKEVIENVPLTIVESSSGGKKVFTAKAVVKIDMGIEPEDYTVRLQVKENDVIYNIYSAYDVITVPGITFVSGLDIQYSTDSRVIDLNEQERPKLSVVFNGTPTFTSGEWTSSDPEIASVDKDGYVELTGTKVGNVTFTFTADDGERTDPDNTHVKAATSESFNVRTGEWPALLIPGNCSTMIARRNESARVVWSSNAQYFTSASFTINVELYEGKLTWDEIDDNNKIYSVNCTKNQNSATIAAGYLKNLSVGGEAAYTVRVSMPHPLSPDGSETLTALAYVIVVPEEANVELSCSKENGYVLDDAGHVDISWEIGNYIDKTTEGTLTVTRVTGDNEASIFYTDSVKSETGSYTLNLPKVSDNALKDTYMVQIQVRNTEDDGWSIDSFPLYVYNSEFLRLVDENNNDIGSKVTLDNKSVVEGYSVSSVSNPHNQSTMEILKLRETLGLYTFVGVNYDSEQWMLLEDSIKWESSDADKVSINYPQGSMYEDIRTFDYDTYIPSIKMMLSSVTDGKVKITATHANTGAKDEVEVEVKTLKNSFYLFKLTPAVTTSMTYTDGEGKTKTVYTNDEGMLALYEPKGIKSDIHLKSKVGDDVYLGTIYADKLLTGEKNHASLELYPLNSFTLRQAAKVDLYLLTDDDTPFVGTVTVRGGVYKNGGFCQDALLGVDTDSLMDGSIGQTFNTNREGKFTVYMDSTQFWSEELKETNADAASLSAADEIEYIFEVSEIDKNKYYPLFITADGQLSPADLMVSAGNLVILEESNGNIGPFVAEQTVRYGDEATQDVRHYNGYVGPNANRPEVTAYTRILLWGESTSVSPNTYKLEVEDEHGIVPECQTNSVTIYPFSSIPVVENVLTMTKATLTDSGWLDPDAGRRTVKLGLRMYKAGKLLQEFPIRFKVVDMTDVEDLGSSSSVAELLKKISDASTFLNGSLKDQIGAITDNNKVLVALSGLLSSTGLTADAPVKMVITPTESNTSFKAMIWVGKDDLKLPDLNYNETGVAWDYNYLQRQDGMEYTTKKLAKMAYQDYTSAKASQEKNAAKNDAKSTTGNNNTKTNSFSQNFTAKNKGSQVNLTVSGYYEAEITYDFAKAKWVIYTTGGGATIGAGLDYAVNINTTVGPVPVTATFQFGGSLQVSLKTAVRYNEVNDTLKWASGYDTVNDFLTELRINAYFEAFGGIGVDYSIVALKIGLFGRITVDFASVYLNRPYLEDESKQKVDGQYLKLTGQAGIKFVVRLAVFSYEAILASASAGYSWDWGAAEIMKYWNTTGSGYDDGSSLLNSTSLPALSSITLQSRTYLNEYARCYGSSETRSLLNTMLAINLVGGDTKLLQSNANPASDLQRSDDGNIYLYVSDQNNSSIYKSRVVAGSDIKTAEVLPSPNDFDGTGDYSPVLDGTDDMAVAAWVRMGAAIPDKDAGDELITEEQTLLLRGSEIVASVYVSGKWTSTRLTQNQIPDLAPAVATNGTKAIAAWRNVYSDNPSNPTDFSMDHINYRIYNGTEWETKEYTLYNGTAGSVKAINAAMLPDGTAMIVYTLDRAKNGQSTDYEVAYTIVNSDGTPGATMIVTNNDQNDENPQVEAVHFGTGDDRFVIGWYNYAGGVGNVKLLAVDKNGIMSNTFPESINEVVNSGDADIAGDFIFADIDMTSGEYDLDDLTIIWSETVNVADENDESSEVADHSILKAVSLRKDGDTVSITAAQQIAELPNRTMVNSFDACVTGEDKVSVVMQATWYDPDNNEWYNMETGESTTDITQVKSGNWTAVPLEQTVLLTADGNLKNGITVDDIQVDFENLALNSLNPIRFTVRNTGIEPITSFTVKLDSEEYHFDIDPLLPNENKTITCYYPIGDEITDPKYQINAKFTSGDEKTSGTVYMSYPDIGVSKMEVVEEAEGLRTVRVTLYNGSPALLKNGIHKVKLGFYADSDYNLIQSVACRTPGVTVEDDKTLTVSGKDALDLLNDGVLTINVVYDLGKYIEDCGEDEIPEEGIRLYMDSWIVRDDCDQNEFDFSNNETSVLLESLLHRSGETLSTSVLQDNTSSTTVAEITLRNNSLQTQNRGALVASLLDENGKVIEQQQVALSETMEGESVILKTVKFAAAGQSVKVTAGLLTADKDDPGLSELVFDGFAIDIDGFTKGNDGVYRASLKTYNENTLVKFQAKSSETEVTINGEKCGSIGSKQVAVPILESVINVKAVNGSNSIEYELTIWRPDPSSDLKVLDFTNTRVDVKDFKVDKDGVYRANFYYFPLEEEELYFKTQSDEAHVTINGQSMDGQEGNMKFKLDFGENVIKIVSVNRGRTTTYILTVNRVSMLGDMYRRYLQTIKSKDEDVKDEEPEETETNELPFKDISPDDPWYDAVCDVYGRGLMIGVSDTLFGPESSMTRAMIVTILYRMDGESKVDGDCTFLDVDTESWYGDAVVWAARNGIVNGYSAKKFGPLDTITREQLAAIFYRYAVMKGYVSDVSEDLSLFDDNKDISEWAIEAMRWAFRIKGLESEDGTNINPKVNALRRQAAVMLYMLKDYITK